MRLKQFIVAGVAVALIGGHAGSFLLGGISRKTVSFDAPITSSETGWSCCTEYFWVRDGGLVTVDYQVTVRRGAFWVYVKREKPGMDIEIAGEARLERSGAGTLQIPINREGIYWIVIDGMPMGQGYDMTWAVTWRVR